MSDPEITLAIRNDGSIVAQREHGGSVGGSINLDKLHRDLLWLFDDWLRRGVLTNRKELSVFGSLLYQVLFTGDVALFFRNTLSELRDGLRLRVQLNFAEDGEGLARLPWEFLFFPGSTTSPDFFVATDERLVLSRYIPLEVGRDDDLVSPEDKLRLLIVVSRPKGYENVMTRDVKEAIQGLAAASRVEVATLELPTLDNLLEILRTSKPHVLHYLGHAQFNRQADRGEILLFDDDGVNPRWYPDDIFAQTFRQAHALPLLIFLQACEGAAVGATSNFAGLASKLVRQNVQAVVAMQYLITNRDAIVFSQRFYREIVQGQPVDYAVQVARWRLTTSSTGFDAPTFGTPVLYMRSRRGIILPQEQSQPASQP